MINCSSCNKQAIYYADHFGKKFCERHFEKYLVAKLRRELYKVKIISPKDNILFKLDGGLNSIGALLLFVNATEKWNINVFVENETGLEKVNVIKFDGQKIDKTVYPEFLQDRVNNILKGLMSGKKKYAWGVDGAAIRPFLSFSGKELATYALLQGFTAKNVVDPELSTISQNISVALALNFIRAYEKLETEF